MTLEIQHPEVNKLARELASYTGETVSTAVVNALRERLEREKKKQKRPSSLKEEILRIGRECAALSILDNRPAEEILAYNDIGVPA